MWKNYIIIKSQGNMKSSIRTYRITSAILMVVCAGLLIHSNHQKTRTAEIVDQYFDLQGEYEKIFDDVQELEEYSEKNLDWEKVK